MKKITIEYDTNDVKMKESIIKLLVDNNRLMDFIDFTTSNNVSETMYGSIVLTRVLSLIKQAKKCAISEDVIEKDSFEFFKGALSFLKYQNICDYEDIKNSLKTNISALYMSNFNGVEIEKQYDFFNNVFLNKNEEYSQLILYYLENFVSVNSKNPFVESDKEKFDFFNRYLFVKNNGDLKQKFVIASQLLSTKNSFDKVAIDFLNDNLSNLNLNNYSAEERKSILFSVNIFVMPNNKIDFIKSFSLNNFFISPRKIQEELINDWEKNGVLESKIEELKKITFNENELSLIKKSAKSKFLDVFSLKDTLMAKKLLNLFLDVDYYSKFQVKALKEICNNNNNPTLLSYFFESFFKSFEGEINDGIKNELLKTFLNEKALKESIKESSNKKTILI